MSDKVVMKKYGVRAGLVILALLVPVLAVVGYVQLMQANLVLQQRVTSMQEHAKDAETSLSVLQQAVTGLREAATAPKQDQVTAALYHRVVAVDDQVDQLPLVVSLQAKPVTTVSSENTRLSWWQLLQKLIVVRRIDHDVIPLIAPEERAFLYQNLHAEMATTIWAVLHQNDAVYQSSLQRSLTWIERYFVKDSPEVNKVIEAIHSLQQVTLTPATS